ncbi:MAG: ABC transporter ATP-binding protein [Christensenellales bacterium]|jgi:NitT/TauT family transport system ATP-binding protein
MADNNIITLSNISHAYRSEQGETPALNNISLSIRRGEFFGLVGPSGCGKTTLLSIIAGLIEPDEGHMRMDGCAGKVAYMLQRDHLFQWRTIFKNCMLGLELDGRDNEETREYTLSLLKQYGLGDFISARPSELSGGMRQKAALIRTLAVQPDALLLDEPFSAIDYQSRLAVSDEMHSIIKHEDKTALLVTHDISEAISMCDRIAVFSQRPASIKTIIETGFDQSPMERRKHPEFKEYFNIIWKELDVHV